MSAPSVLELPDGELTPDQAELKAALLNTATAQEQAAADRALSAHLNARVVALRAQLNEALGKLEALENAPKPGAAGGQPRAPRKPRAKRAPVKQG